ncbi:MAG: hypothetical protein WCE63_08010 [Acidobacteriaceae bacterium]
MSRKEETSTTDDAIQYGFYSAVLLAAILIVLVSHFVPKKSSFEVSPVKFKTPALAPGYMWSQHYSTAVIVIRDGCHFCENSLPFYRRLVMMEQRAEIRSHVIFVLPNPLSVAIHDVPDNVGEKRLFPEVRMTFGVRGTPTVLLINSAGIVTRAWQGQLTSADEARVISALK